MNFYSVSIIVVAKLVYSLCLSLYSTLFQAHMATHKHFIIYAHNIKRLEMKNK